MPPPPAPRSVALPWSPWSAAIFLFVVLSLLGAVHSYPAWRLLGALVLPDTARWAIALAVAACAALPILFIVAIRPRASEPVRRACAWLAYGELGFALALFDLVLARDLLWGAAWIAGLLRPVLPADPATLAGWERASALACLGGATGLVAGGVYVAHRTPRLREVTVPIPGLAPGLHGLRIVQLCDLHVGPTIRRRFVERVAAAVERARPDLIAFTGDLADGPAEELAPHVEPLRQLSASLGVWAVTGNHDYYVDPEGWLAAMPGLGLRLLLNGHQVLERDGAILILGGLPDPTGAEAFPGHPDHRPDPEAVFRGAPEGPRLLLVHQPRTAVTSAAAGADLTLCGHTHGGQLLPWHALVRLQQPLLSGLGRTSQGGWIYVSRGAGYWGPPLRLGVPSEITCLTLVPG